MYALVMGTTAYSNMSKGIEVLAQDLRIVRGEGKFPHSKIFWVVFWFKGGGGYQ